MNAFISTITDALLGVFAIVWAPVCVAVFLFFVVYALWPTNWKKFFPAAAPVSPEEVSADRSSNP